MVVNAYAPESECLLVFERYESSAMELRWIHNISAWKHEPICSHTLEDGFLFNQLYTYTDELEEHLLSASSLPPYDRINRSRPPSNFFKHNYL
jgi:hypothetical protein